MIRRARPTTPLGWGILASHLLALLLMIWAVAPVDWWSTATSLYDPDDTGGLVRGRITEDGESLLGGFPSIAIALVFLVSAGWFLSVRRPIAAGFLGFVGVVLTAVASQLDSPITGLVTTNAWIPAFIAWFFYFGALAAAVSTRAPQLEFEPSPDSSDG